MSDITQVVAPCYNRNKQNNVQSKWDYDPKPYKMLFISSCIVAQSNTNSNLC